MKEEAMTEIQTFDSDDDKGKTPAPPPKKTTEIVLSPPPTTGDVIGLSHYQMQNRAALWAIARTYQLGGLVPKSIAALPVEEGAAQVFTMLSTGMELGLGFATSLRTIYIVEGRASMSSDLMRGLAINAGCRFEYERNDEEACRIVVYRNEKKVGVAEFSMQDAIRAGVAGRGTWNKYPKAMLAARAGAMAARLGAPDRLAGLHAPEEIEDDRPGITDEEIEAHIQNANARQAFGDGLAKQMQEDHAKRAKDAAAALGVPVSAFGSDFEPMTDAQRRAVMRLGAALGIRSNVELPDGKGGTEKRTVIRSDDEINKALFLPLGEDVVVKNLSKTEATALIDILLKREAVEEAEFAKKEDSREEKKAVASDDEDGYREGQE